MFFFKFAVLASLAALIAAEVNITLNADGTGFEVTGLQHSMERVIDGHTAKTNQFPWHATIFSRNAQGRWHFLSGALISRSWVVTIATGVRGSTETRVLLGSNAFGRGQTIISERHVEHPRFRETGSRLVDIAVVRLIKPVRINSAIRPIPLAPSRDSDRRFDREFGRLSGFGSAVATRPHSSLQWAELRVTRQEFCREHFPNFAGPLFYCALNFRETGARPGFGDIGAPFVWRSVNGVHLIGLAFASTRDDVSGYLNLAHHTRFLAQFVH